MQSEKLTPPWYSRVNPSAVINHLKVGHLIDFENSCIIYPESHMTKRKIAESLLYNNNNMSSTVIEILFA